MKTLQKDNFEENQLLLVFLGALYWRALVAKFDSKPSSLSKYIRELFNNGRPIIHMTETNYPVAFIFKTLLLLLIP